MYETCRNCSFRCRCCASHFFDTCPLCSGCENHYDEFHPAKHIKKCPLAGEDIETQNAAVAQLE